MWRKFIKYIYRGGIICHNVWNKRFYLIFNNSYSFFIWSLFSISFGNFFYLMLLSFHSDLISLGTLDLSFNKHLLLMRSPDILLAVKASCLHLLKLLTVHHEELKVAIVRIDIGCHGEVRMLRSTK